MNLAVVKNNPELLAARLAALPEKVADLWRQILGQAETGGIIGIIWLGNRQEVTEGEPLLMFTDGLTKPVSSAGAQLVLSF